MGTCKITKINEETFVFTDLSLGWYYNSTVILTKEGPIIIDVFSAKEQFEEVKKFILEKGFYKPAAIIYTHWHSDHTSGNKDFKDCRIISHKASVKHLENLINKLKGIRREDALPMLPNETFEDDFELNIGDKKLQLIHCPGHTYDSILVFDNKNKVLVSGDNLVGEEVDFCMPPVIPADAEETKHEYLLDVYKIIENLNPQIIIPGHGCTTDKDKLLKLNRERYNKCLKENLSNTK